MRDAAARPPAPALASGPAGDAATGVGDPVDGVYRGRTVLTGMRGRRCGRPDRAVVVIRNRHITRRFNATTLLEATVQPDGTFAAQAGRASMTGKVGNGHLEADIGNEYCQHHLTLDRS